MSLEVLKCAALIACVTHEAARYELRFMISEDGLRPGPWAPFSKARNPSLYPVSRLKGPQMPELLDVMPARQACCAKEASYSAVAGRFEAGSGEARMATWQWCKRVLCFESRTLWQAGGLSGPSGRRPRVRSRAAQERPQVVK